MKTKEEIVTAFKKALTHKKEANERFEHWLQERGIDGKVISL